MSTAAENCWRWEAKGTLIYEGGERCSVALDRIADGRPTEILADLIEILDGQTTWELERCVIELRCYEEAAASDLARHAAEATPRG